jgi:hypothetical protein
MTAHSIRIPVIAPTTAHPSHGKRVSLERSLRNAGAYAGWSRTTRKAIA